MVAIMTCGTAGGTAGQIAEIRVTLTSSDHREVDEYSLCHKSHSSSCESPLSLCKHFTHILTTLVAYIINVYRIVGIAGPVHSPKPFEIDTSPIQ